jgi:hypothetical protein
MLAIDKQITQARPIHARLIPINAPPTETARWKRCVPRFSPIKALLAQAIFSHRLQLIINKPSFSRPEAMKDRRIAERLFVIGMFQRESL